MVKVELYPIRRVRSYLRRRTEFPQLLHQKVAKTIEKESLRDAKTRPVEQILATTTPSERVDSIKGTVLSNFEPIQVLYKGKRYGSVEIAYQAAKFLPGALRNVPEEALQRVNAKLMDMHIILAPLSHLEGVFRREAMNSRAAKEIAAILGDRESNYHLVRKDWFDVNLPIMADLLIQKYQNPKAAKALLDTGKKEIIEGSKNDRFYGYVFATNEGTNYLGRMLMSVRKRLQDGTLKTQA